MPQIVYLAGWGRSGSTLLCRMLDLSESVAAVGELRYLWDGQVLCGCGLPVRTCPFWSGIRTQAGVADRDLDGLAATVHQGLVGRALPSVLRGNISSDLEAYRSTMCRIYEAIGAQDPSCEVIVDDSKAPTDAALLAASMPVKLLHLVRDPRATAYSWAHRPNSQLQRVSISASTRRWMAWNAGAELVGRYRAVDYLRLRYEDFVGDPNGTLDTIASFLGIERSSLPVLGSERVVDLPTSHQVNGNPNRFERGATALRLDDRWRASLPRSERWLVTLFTGPQLVREGYPLSVSAGSLSPQ